MTEKNPFAGPFGEGGPFGDASPISTPGTSVPACPQCKASNFDTRQNQYETLRICRACGQVWSGGTLGSARVDPRSPPLPPAGMAPEDDDFPQNTAADFRNPLKNWGSDEDW